MKRFLPALILMIVAAAPAPAAASKLPPTNAPSIDLARVAYTQSGTCVRCHPVHEASWQRTFHRTMTQRATPQAVLGDFDGAAYTYQGVTSRFTHADGRYYMETLGPAHQMQRYEVVMTVGSRRVQQYVTQLGDRHFRLPLAWDVRERHWFHLNGGFLHPDGADFDTHFSLWDANCIFCHNTKPDPGMNLQTTTFDAHVQQLGIACEACHGPGAEHVAANANPLRRYQLYLSGKQDPTIYAPDDLAKLRQVQMCGHCHGQRTPNPQSRLAQFLAQGDPYTAGDDLSQYTTPIWRDTQLAGADFSLRFWKDGTPRLTAYEYQGLLMSPDFQRGDLTCLSCHSMHGGDPRGMIEPSMRTNAACAGCHAKLVTDGAQHARHKAGGTGVNCYGCHMPNTVYGLMDVHPTHRMQNPDPARAWRYDMPEACTLCHTNQTAAWAAREMARQYGKPVPADLPAGPDYAIAEDVRALLGGDVVQRAVAVEAMASDSSYTPNDVDRLWALPFLIVSMEDNYPAIRHFAVRAAKKLVERAAKKDPDVAGAAATLPDFDPQADASARRAAVESWRAWWRALDKSRIARPGEAVPLDAQWEPDARVVARLRGEQDTKIIAIGE